MFKHGLPQGGLKRLPHISMYDEPETNMRALSDSECDALLQAAIGDQSPDAWLFVLVALSTSCRSSEIVAMRFEHIDAANLRIFIPNAKAGARWQPVPQELLDVLAREREMRDDTNGWLFPSERSRNGHQVNFNRPFARIAERAGLDPKQVTPHTCRRTAITNLVQEGVDVATVKKISGHRTLDMVMRYVNLHAPHVNAAAGKLGRKMPEIPDTITHKLHRTAEKAGSQNRQPANKSLKLKKK